MPWRQSSEEEYIARFWSYVNKCSGVFYKGTECWFWTAGKSNKGYGYFWYWGRTVQAYTLAWLFSGLKRNPELELDHLCRNHACVNPGHLEEVTRLENQHRGLTLAGNNKRKTNCPQGHPYSGWNLIIDTKGSRVCRKCLYVSRKEWLTNKKEKQKIAL